MPDQDPRRAAAPSYAREVRPAPSPDDVAPPPEPRQPRSGLATVIVLLILGAAVAGIVYWFTSRQAPTPTATASSEANPPIAVGVAAVTKGDMPVILDALGTVTPLATVTVKSQVSGHITDIKFQEGQSVEKGDLLAVIDVRPFTIALESARATLAHDQALLTNAKLDLARYQKLLSEDSVAKQTVDTQASLVIQDQATVQLDQAAVDNAALNLDYCHVTAPITGRVGLRQVDVGNYVAAGNEGIVVITQMQPITVVFALPEDDLPAIMKRLHDGAELPTTAYDRSMTTKIATGRLATVDNQIDTTTGTVKLKAQFDNEDDSLFPNQFVNVRLQVDTMTGVAVVPRAAVLHGAPGDYVYVVKPDDTAAIQVVKPGPSQGERIAILSGLEPGQRVVVDGTDRLREGAKVNIASTGKPTAGANAAPSTTGAPIGSGNATPSTDARPIGGGNATPSTIGQATAGESAAPSTVGQPTSGGRRKAMPSAPGL
jgi:multidrug efflux system membrane fusion protein